MKSKKLGTWRHWAAAATLATCASGAMAQEDRFSFHGFGNQDFWKSSSNSFDGSGDKGTWDNNFLAVDVSATINDRSKAWAQLETSTNGGTFFTWFFVDYNFNDDLRAHVGAVKFPIGIYNEYIDARALQMSVLLPVVYSQEADLVHDAYEGVGLDYDWHLGSSGKIVLQGYFGNNYSPAAASGPSVPFPAQQQQGDLQAGTNDERTFGGRVTWETPVNGLRFLLSANTVLIETTAGNGQIPGQTGYENRDMASVDYVNDTLDVKAEIMNHRVPGLSGYADLTSRAWYVQVGYLGIDRWTPYVQYDNLVTDTSKSSDPSYYERDFVVGTNFKIRDNLNFRVEEHFNHGYALPVAAGETEVDAGKATWNLFAASVNFMF
jgi:hypothetical protein